MKKIKYLQMTAVLMAAAGLTTYLFDWKIPAIVFAAVLVGLLIASIRMTILEEEVEAFLVKENRKSRENVVWSEEDIERLEILRKRSELSALQYQINPHFLYNTLDNIRAQAYKDGSHDIAQMTEKLSRFFRYAISNRSALVTVDEELIHIDDYYYIQKKRFGNRFEMKVILEDEELRRCYMPKLLLQPLVENAIVHGLEKRKEGGIVTIRLFNLETDILIEVWDNGAGMREEALHELNERLESNKFGIPTRSGRNNGIAIQNVNARIRLTFGDDYGIRYRSMEGYGTTARVRIPYVDQYNRAEYEKLLSGELERISE